MGLPALQSPLPTDTMTIHSLSTSTKQLQPSPHPAAAAQALHGVCLQSLPFVSIKMPVSVPALSQRDGAPQGLGEHQLPLWWLLQEEETLLPCALSVPSWWVLLGAHTPPVPSASPEWAGSTFPLPRHGDRAEMSPVNTHSPRQAKGFGIQEQRAPPAPLSLQPQDMSWASPALAGACPVQDLLPSPPLCTQPRSGHGETALELRFQPHG